MRSKLARPPEPRLNALARVPHGGPDYHELAGLGLSADRLLDFSVNSNPLGASPKALEAIRSVDPSRYPDSQVLGLRSALAAVHDCRPSEVLVGNGSVELIWLLAEAYLQPGDGVVVVGPTFGEYAAAVRRRSGDLVEYRANEADGFRPRLEDAMALVRRVRPRLVFVCNPNNPTGQALELAELDALLDACGETLLVVDEAYIDFAEGLRSALGRRDDPRVVVLRSLTKNFGLAGLRLGYLVAAPSVVAVLEAAQLPWSVNAFAQAAGLAALGDGGHLAAGCALAARARAHLSAGLAQLGLASVPSRTNFWLVEVQSATELRRQLLRHGILVRDCSSFGLPRHVRLAARPLAECDDLLKRLAELR